MNLNSSEIELLEEAFAAGSSANADQQDSILNALYSRSAVAANMLSRMWHVEPLNDAQIIEAALGGNSAQHSIHRHLRHTFIDRYRILSVLGEGGMSIVYLAEELPPMHRLVAIKVIKPGMDTRRVLARFDAERQTLATLNHPAIVPVLNAGSTTDGHPFIVMPLVAGLPLRDFVRQHALSLRHTLQLFIEVCSAVEHAHSKGVIHRDLKPGNILVVAHPSGPRISIIDFGLAKAMADSLLRQHTLTIAGEVVGTPHYMSPEQARGESADTLSDIFSLGAVLYELLTGVVPLAPAIDECRTVQEIASRYDTTAIPAPSQRPSERADQARIPAELDWITQRCLAIDPKRRYPTVAALRSDVRNLLAGKDISAGPDSRLYRFKRLVNRHRYATAITSTIAAALVTTTAISMYALGRQRQSSAELQRVVRQYQLLFDGLSPDIARGKDTELLRIVLRSAIHDLQSTDLSDRTLMEVGSTLASAAHSIGDISYVIPLATRLKEVGERSELGYHSLRSRSIALSILHEQRWSSFVEMQSLRNDIQRFGSLNSYSREYFEIAEASTFADIPFEDIEALATLAVQRLDRDDLLLFRIRRRFAKVLIDYNKPNAFEYLEQLRSDANSILGQDHPVSLELIPTMSFLLSSQSRYEDVVPLLQNNLPLLRQTFGPSSRPTWVAENNLGVSLARLGCFDESEDIFRHTIQTQKVAGGPSSRNAMWSQIEMLTTFGMAGSWDKFDMLEQGMWADQSYPPAENHVSTQRVAAWLLFRGEANRAARWLGQLGADLQQQVYDLVERERHQPGSISRFDK